MRRIMEEELFKEKSQNNDISEQEENSAVASNGVDVSDAAGLEFDNASGSTENSGIYEEGNIAPEDYTLERTSSEDIPAGENDPHDKDRFIIRENYSCDVYDDDPIVRKSSQSITRDDLVVFAKLQSYFKKNRIKNIAGMIISVLLLLAAFSGLIMMAFSHTADAVIQSVEVTSDESDKAVSGTATYKYSVNNTEYTGKYNFRDNTIEYIPKEGGVIPVYYLKFMPSFSLEQREVIPGFIQVVLMFAAAFILYESIHGMVENKTIKKYFRDRDIVWD